MGKIFFPLLLLFCSVGIVRAQSTDIEGGIQLYESKNLQGAKEVFLEFNKNHPQDAKSYYYLGRISFDEREYKQAEKWFKQAVKFDESNSDYNLWLAQTYGTRARMVNFFSKLSLAKKSKKHFELAVKFDENNAEAREGLITYHLNAPGIAGGDLNKALQQAQILVKMDERKGRMLLARIYVKKKEINLAEKEYRRVEELCGDSPECFGFYNSYGYFLLQQKKYDEAIVRFQKQVELAPDKANPHDSLGDGYRAAGRLAEAADEYRKALQIDPTFGPPKKKLHKIVKN